MRYQGGGAATPSSALTSHEPSLEDIFLRYYQGDGQALPRR